MFAAPAAHDACAHRRGAPAPGGPSAVATQAIPPLLDQKRFVVTCRKQPTTEASAHEAVQALHEMFQRSNLSDHALEGEGEHGGETGFNIE